MPVVTAAVPTHAAIGELLLGLADVVAAALGLGADDVIAVHVPTGASAKSGADGATAVSAWHIVGIHGSERESASMEAAAEAARVLVVGWCERHLLECEGVWVHWLTPHRA